MPQKVGESRFLSKAKELEHCRRSKNRRGFPPFEMVFAPSIVRPTTAPHSAGAMGFSIRISIISRPRR
jgi:hypothetical protein